VDVLPQLDLVGSLGSSGLAGTGRDVIFGADTLRTDLDTGLGDSWSQVFQGDFRPGAPGSSSGCRSGCDRTAASATCGAPRSSAPSTISSTPNATSRKSSAPGIEI